VQWTRDNFGVARFAKALFAFGLSIGVVEDNPFAGLTVSKKSAVKMCPTPQQVREAANAALVVHAGATGVLVHDMVLASSQTGLRLNELSGLRSEHVEITPTGMTLHVIGKGGRYRQVPVPPQVAHIVQRRMVSRLIFGRAGDQLTRQAIHRLMKPVREKTGLLDMNWHLLRHHYATQLANNGVLDRDAALVMFGHTNPRLLHDVYSHPDRAVAVSRVADQLAVAA
jgi:site-specific recombinase XerD